MTDDYEDLFAAIGGLILAMLVTATLYYWLA